MTWGDCWLALAVVVLITALVLLGAHIVHGAETSVVCDIAPAATLRVVRVENDADIARSAWTRAQLRVVEAGGLRLHSYLADTPGDYVLCGIAVQAGAVCIGPFDRLALEGDGWTATSIELLRTESPMEYERLTSSDGFCISAEEKHPTNTGACLVIARFPDGSVTGRPLSATWREAGR